MHQFSISIWPAAQMSEFWLHVSEVEVLENGEEIGSFNLKLTSAKYTAVGNHNLPKAKNNLGEIYIFRSTS